MKRIWLLVLLILLITGCSIANTTNQTCNIDLPNGSPPEKINLYFFYGNGCSHCANVEPVIEELEERYKDYIIINKYEIYRSKPNQDIYLKFIEKFNVKQDGIPAVFMGNEYLIGDRPIIDNIDQLINYNLINWEFCPPELDITGINEGYIDQKSPRQEVKFTLPALLTAAAIDSINPCAFSVLIFLLLTISSIGVRKKILKIGLTFITVVFITYFLSGIGLFAIIQISQITRIIYMSAATLAIIAGLINLKDFFWYGKGFSLKISESKHETLKKYMMKATIPASITLGILVSIFELPCTGSVYLAILGMLAVQTTKFHAMLYLLLYNFIFILPLLIILLVVYYGIPPEKLNEWRLKKRKWLRLIMGLVMIALGVVMLYGWV